MSYNISTTLIVVFIILAVWDLIWRGMALWRSAHRNQGAWFVVLLVINSAGILPILYLALTGKESGHEHH